ncbi:MAG: prolipoprotein diacylglyceryl transferase [Firmicutes bacterium]|nr:prolipoprotein diacylglyceryl transferase [Bacillota bacterium]
MNTVIFPWGPFTFSVLSLSFSAAILVGLIAVIIAGRRERLSFQRIIDFILISMVCGVVGGRLGHVLLVNRDYYFQNPEQIIRLQDGGVSFWGGFLLALAVAIFWARRRGYSLEPYLDAAAPALVLGLSLGKIGYSLQGKAMSGAYPWGVLQDGQLVHPDGAYAIVLLMLLYFYLNRCYRRVHYKGELMLFFIVGYGLINLVVDHFRVLPAVWWQATAGQLVSLVMILLALVYMIGGSKVYPSSHYFARKIDRSPPSRLKSPLRVLWGLLFIAVQLYPYFMVNGFPVGLTNLVPLRFLIRL